MNFIHEVFYQIHLLVSALQFFPDPHDPFPSSFYVLLITYRVQLGPPVPVCVQRYSVVHGQPTPGHIHEGK